MWTWWSLNQHTTNTIDLILTNSKWKTTVQQCRTYQGADIESDHRLVISNIKLNLKRREKQTFKKQRDVAKLKENDVAVKYVTELKRCLQDVTASSIDERTEQLSSAIRETVNSSIPGWEHIKKKWITEATLEKIQQKRKLKLV